MTTTHKTDRRSLAGVTGKQAESPAPRSRVWLWVFVAFTIQIGVWTAWITIASRHKVQEVPLATTELSR